MNQTVISLVSACQTPDFISADDWIRYLTYTVCPPIFFTMGIPGHVIALIAFFKQSRSESAYGYQVFVTVVKTVDILTFNLFILFTFHLADQNWSGTRGDQGWAWFKNQYFLMWFTGHVASVIQSAFITIPILASAAMAMDRVIGLSWPIRYRSMNKTVHRTLAYTLCLSIGILVSIDCSWRWAIVQQPIGYKLASTTFGRSVAGTVSSQLRNAVRFVAEILLITCSIAVIVLYQKRIRKVANMTRQNDGKEAERKAQQKALVVLTLFQSASTMAGTVYLAAYSYANYFNPSFASCPGPIVSTMFDFTLQLVNAMDFYLLYITSGSIRTVIKKNLGSTSQPINQQSQNIQRIIVA